MIVIFSNIEELRKTEFKEREKKLKYAIPQKIIYNPKSKKTLNITYVMTWTEVCGGSKIILQHANKLTHLGHNITLISHYPKPTWFPLDKRIHFIQVPWDKVLCKSIPQCDIIIATYWREIYECVEQKIAPVVYFEQGDFHLFDLDKLDKRTYNYISKQLKTVKFIYTVSTFAKEKLNEIYNVEASVIPNAVDSDIFFYMPHKKNLKPTITIIGSENSDFKRISNILQAIKIIKNKGYEIELNWITPDTPSIPFGNTIINPDQHIIGDVLRSSDIFICASIYEAFCLPVLEAMTCGTAVITTNNGGNMDFVENNNNALLVEKDNINDLVEKMELLLVDSALRNKIAINGVETSKQFSWDKTINQIVQYYKKIANYDVL